MREILFRGKRIDNGEWAEGFYSAEEYNQFTNSIEYIPCIQLLGKCVRVEVIPETVGQFTGLVDKNCRKIFEGDIVRIPSYEAYGKQAKVVVAYNNVTANFDLIGVTFKTDFYNYHGDECEIIGNVHDNPNLLYLEVTQNDKNQS